MPICFLTICWSGPYILVNDEIHLAEAVTQWYCEKMFF